MKKYTKILSLIAVLICIVFMSGCAKNITVEYQIDDTVITTQQYAKNNKIKLKIKIYSEFECECLYMDYLTYYDDPECDLSEEEKEFQKSLDGTGVTRDEYNKILKKLETLNEHF